MKELKRALEDRICLEDQYEATVNKAKGRELNESETSRLREIETELKTLDKTIGTLQAKENHTKKIAAKQMNNSNYSDDDETYSESSNEIDFSVLKKSAKRTPIADFVRAHREITEDQEVSVWSVLPVLLGKKTKDKKVLDVVASMRALSGNSNVLNDYLSAQIMDAALPKSRLIQAGMKTIPLLSGTHRFGKIGTLPTLEWKTELDSTTERTASIDSVEFVARTLRGWVQCGSEFLQDGVNAEEIIRRLLTTAVAQGIDTAGLTGSGTPPVPLGIINHTGVSSFTVGSVDSYTDIIVGQRLIWEADGNDATAIILSPNVMAQYAALAGTTEKQTIIPPPLLGDLKFLQTSKLSSGTTAVLGDFSSMTLGIRLDATIYVSPVISETYGVKFLVAFRGDIVVTKESDFCLLEGITSADLT